MTWFAASMHSLTHPTLCISQTRLESLAALSLIATNQHMWWMLIMGKSGCPRNLKLFGSERRDSHPLNLGPLLLARDATPTCHSTGPFAPGHSWLGFATFSGASDSRHLVWCLKWVGHQDNSTKQRWWSRCFHFLDSVLQRYVTVVLLIGSDCMA